MTNYFANVPEGEMKAAYRKFAQQMHPDKGGNAEAFKEMKRQYEQWEKTGKKASPEAPKQQAQNTSGAVWREMGGVMCRRVVKGWYGFDVREVVDDRATCTGEGVRFNFSPSSWQRNNQVRSIYDRDSRTFAEIQGRFIAKNISGRVEISDLDIIRKNPIKVNVYSDGVFFGTFMIPDHEDYLRFLNGKDTSLSAKYRTKAIKDIRVRPDIEWMFEEEYFKVSVTIKVIAPRLHMMDKTIEDEGFIDRLKRAWRVIIGKA